MSFFGHRSNLIVRSPSRRWVRYIAWAVFCAYLLLAVVGELTHAYEHSDEWHSLHPTTTQRVETPSPHFASAQTMPSHTPCPICTWQANNLYPTAAPRHLTFSIEDMSLFYPPFLYESLHAYPPPSSSRAPPQA